MISFFIFLLIASICGAIGSSIAGFSSQGCLTNIGIGLVGAIIGSWFSRMFGVPDVFVWHNIPILWTIVGSGLFVLILSKITSSRRRWR